MSSATKRDDEQPGLGWLLFAGTILGIGGAMRIFDASWALRYDGELPDDFDSAVLGTTLTTYAWAWLVVGVILLLASFAILARTKFARWIGIVGGALMVISAFVWMPYYPVWSLTYIMIGVCVIYALAVHGGGAHVEPTHDDAT